MFAHKLPEKLIFAPTTDLQIQQNHNVKAEEEIIDEM